MVVADSLFSRLADWPRIPQMHSASLAEGTAVRTLEFLPLWRNILGPPPRQREKEGELLRSVRQMELQLKLMPSSGVARRRARPSSEGARHTGHSQSAGERPARCSPPRAAPPLAGGGWCPIRAQDGCSFCSFVAYAIITPHEGRPGANNNNT